MPKAHDFDEVLSTDNTCRDGFYAPTAVPVFKKHMPVFVTVPYSTAFGAINREYLGEVIRVDSLPDGRTGIAVHLVAPLSLSVQGNAATTGENAPPALWRIPNPKKA